MGSVLEVFGRVDKANLSKNRHWVCPMFEAPRKGNADVSFDSKVNAFGK